MKIEEDKQFLINQRKDWVLCMTLIIHVKEKKAELKNRQTEF